MYYSNSWILQEQENPCIIIHGTFFQLFLIVAAINGTNKIILVISSAANVCTYTVLSTVNFTRVTF